MNAFVVVPRGCCCLDRSYHPCWETTARTCVRLVPIGVSANSQCLMSALDRRSGLERIWNTANQTTAMAMAMLTMYLHRMRGLCRLDWPNVITNRLNVPAPPSALCRRSSYSLRFPQFDPVPLGVSDPRETAVV